MNDRTKPAVGILLIAVTVALITATFPQGQFTSIPPDLAPKYRFDFARNFFASPEVEMAERAKHSATLKELEALKGKVGVSADTLLRALQLNDRLQLQFTRHYIYLYLRYAVNTKDEDSRDTQQKLGAEVTQRTSFLQQELMKIEARTFERFAAQRPALKPYRFAVEAARRLKPHTLSLKEEELLSALGPLMTEWQAELYQKSLDRTAFGKVKSAGGELDVWKDQGALHNSPDRSGREAGFRKLYEGYRTHRDLQAFALTRLLKAENEVARIKRYDDSPAAVYFGLHLPSADVKGLFERLGQSADFNKRYQRLRAGRIQQIAGYDEVNYWDLSVVPPGKERPRFAIGEATNVITDSLKPFGEEYARELAALLDPKNGRLDLVTGDNRVPGAFAWGFPGGTPSIFYSFNYEGYFDDVLTLAHEAGHAVHFNLMGAHKVMPVFTDGPGYFFESFAMFNELLLADALFARATDTYRKTFFLEKFLDNAMAVFPITRQAALEQAMYDGVKAGTLKAADDFDSLAKKNGQRYSIYFDKHDELKMEWINIHHYYDAPLYYVNYVFANFLAVKYYEMFTRDQQSFLPKYLALVNNGFNDSPPALLKKFLGLDLRDPKLVGDTFAVLEGKIKALEGLYAK